MQNIKFTLTVEGLDGLLAAMDKLTGAIQAQKVAIIPTGYEPADPEFTNPASNEEVVKAVNETVAAAESGPSVSAKEVREKFTELAREGKRDELRAVLAEFGVENVSALEESMFDAVFERLEAL